MWGTKTLERARRRFGRTASVPDPDPVAATSASPQPADFEIRLSRGELHSFAARLDARLADAGLADERGTAARLDTPARLTAALARRIEAAGGRGRPVVERSPAGLYTPEYWRIHVTGADEAARTEVERLVRVAGAGS